ncbi:transcriptional regulator, TetR family [Ekhidna lutea]|uniref:Transcriptional regulator, TetR family n=1 Tax=Ekhidna lutea TaxID=447679 RepID=A0A239J3J2_EKHLU|nr:TetR/AcrR family transcriptional regulator [Ekhidna lutea]SNT00232.1 transcriptional regulator, TetR family [Ekhidna lutea]
MTEKQEKILEVALDLFAKDGYAATSTSKVAKEAGVSEGLIFRHFVSKEGLLRSILELGEKKAQALFQVAEGMEDPKEVLRRIIGLPFNISEDQYAYWKLIYSLKWQASVYDDSMSKPIKEMLIPAFADLGYSNPTVEAETILVIIDGLVTAILLRDLPNPSYIKQSLFNKYRL